MKERPILFNAEMVRAILDGRKTQTRRVIKPQPIIVGDGLSWPLCPYGIPGDRLWVRETFALESSQEVSYDPPFKDGRPLLEVDGGFEHGTWWEQPHYKATDPEPELSYDGEGPCVKWSPSIYMPRWASRILLEITDIRVERVKDISRDDAFSEGHPFTKPKHPEIKWNFEKLWNSINEKKGLGWDKNPWVWVIEFKAVGND